MEFNFSRWQNNGTLRMPVRPFDLVYIRSIFIVLYGAVCLACITGNVLVILVIARHRKMKNITNFFLANLAVADICVGVFCVMPSLASYLSTTWYLGKIMCKLNNFVQSVSYTASIIILTVISLERYFAIIYPMLSKRVSRMCVVKCTTVIIWVITIGYSIPILISYDTVDVIGQDNITTQSFCVKKMPIKMEAYILINFLVWYIIPVFMMTGIYSKISVVLWRSATVGQELASAETIRRNNREPEAYPLKDLKAQDKEDYIDHSDYENGERSGVRIIITSGNDQDHSTMPCSISDYETGAGNIYCPSRAQGSLQVGNRHHRQQEHDSLEAENVERSDTAKCHISSGSNQPDGTVNLQKNRYRKHSKPLAARKKVIQLVIAIVVGFAVCVLPHHIRLLWQTFNSKPDYSFSDLLAPPVTFLIFYMNSCLNPFLYAFLSDNFRNAFWELDWRTCIRQKRRSTPTSHNLFQTHQTSQSPSRSRTSLLTMQSTPTSSKSNLSISMIRLSPSQSNNSLNSLRRGSESLLSANARSRAGILSKNPV